MIWVGELGSWIGRWRSDLGRGAWFVDRPVKKGFGSWSLVHGSAGEERIWVAGAWFMDRLVKKWSGSRSLVRGSAGEEVIWVRELGLWIGRWRKDLGRQCLVHGSAGEERIWVAKAWFVDWPVKKGSRPAGEERTWIGRWRKDPVKNEKERERPGSFWERMREGRRERERDRWSVKWVMKEGERAYVLKW